MAISASTVTTTDTLETFRVEFNNLVADVTSIQQVGASDIVISDGGNIGTASDADAMSISAGGVVTFTQAPTFSGGTTISSLDIDGATDISAAIVDADLFIIDDGASGTNRKTAASRIKTYIADVTLTTAAQTNITSVGTLTALDVDNININGNTITASSGAVNITPAGGSAIVLDGTVNVDAGVVTGVTSLTSNAILIADAGTIGSASSTSAITVASTGIVTFVDDILIKDAGTIGNASVADVMSLASTGIVTFKDDIIIKDGGTIGATSATTAITIASSGIVTFVDDILIKDGGTIGAASATDAITIASTGIVTFVDDIIIKDAGTIGSASDTDAISISSGGVVNISATTANTGTGDGALTVAGGVGIALDASVGDDLRLISDGALLLFGANEEIVLRHEHNSGLTIINTVFGSDDTPVVLTLQSEENAIETNDVIASLEFAAGDSDGTDGATVAAGIHAIAEADFTASVNKTKLVFTTGVSETAASSATAKMTLSSAGLLTIADDFVIKDGGTIGSASDTDAIAIASDGVVTFSQGITVSGGSDGDTLLTFSIDRAWSFLQSGDDGGTSLVLKSNIDAKSFEIANANGDVDFRFFTSHAGGDPQLQLGEDANIRFEGSTGDTNRTVLTVIDPTANRTISLPNETGTVHTSGGSITIPDAGTIGSASDTDAIAISSGGVVTMNQIPVFSAGINVSGGSIAGTLSTAAQTNITSLGTLTTLTVDDITINGSTISDAGDFALDISGDIILDANGADIIFKDNGTEIGRFTNSSSDFVIESKVQDKDIIFKGDDGGVVISALRLDMSAAGGAHFNQYLKSGNYFWSNTDNGEVLRFGTSAEIRVHHVHDTGLTFTNTIADTDNRPFVLQLKSEEDAIAQDDVIASIEMAAGDSDGTDGATVAAGIHAIAEDTFSASANKTKLVFTTGVSETAASSATAKMTLSSVGLLTIADDFMIKDGGTIGVASANDAITISSAGIVTFKDDILIKDGGTIGTATDADAITIAAAGAVTLSQRSVHSSGITVADGGQIGSASDADAIAIAADGVVTFSQKVVIDGGIDVDNFHIDGDTISRDSAGSGDMTLDAAGDIILDANGADLIFKDNGTEIGRFTNSSTDLVMQVTTQDKDILFKGDDGGSAITALTLDMSAAGKATFNDSISTPALLFLSTDGEKIAFGADTEVTIRHVHNSGLQLRNSLTGNVGGFVLTLQSGEQDIAINDVIGAINFQAYQESTGTDAILVAAGIEAVSEGDFSSSNNATKLSFKTGASETAAEKMSLSSTGLLTIADDFMIKDGGTIGVASTNDAITISSAGIVTFKDDIIIKDGGTIGSASATDAITIASSGDVTLTGASANVVWDKSDDALEFADDAYARFGNSDDLNIRHSGGNSHIAHGGAGDLYIRSGRLLVTNAAANETMINAVADGAVELYHDNSKKIETTSAGVTVTGELLTTAFSSTDFAAAKIVMNRSATDGTDAGDNIIDETDSDNMLMENVTSWVTSGFTIRDSFGNHLQTVNGVS